LNMAQIMTLAYNDGVAHSNVWIVDWVHMEASATRAGLGPQTTFCAGRRSSISGNTN
jgi:hypothetical protein